ncbi:MAG TPA: hypothetical protein VFN49_03135 [Candidatus Aquilonibacter sp.]|nr:hypothetical protein [Candidatus Aquilonibacter sp.]
MNRRQWIGSGVAAALLVGAGLLYESQPDPAPADSFDFRALTPADRGILAAIGPVMLAGALPSESDAHNAFIDGFDTAVSGLTPSVQAEVAQLFMLLRVAPLRMMATGVMKPWHEASAGDIERFLTGWRYSGITKLRSAYDALHQLAYGAWYGNPRSWHAIGYGGPPKL